METISVVLISILVIIFVYLFNKVKKNFAYFEDKGIPYVPGVFPLGSNIKGALFLQPFTTTFETIYRKLKSHKVGGMFQYLRPVYVVTDPEIVNKIFISDFTYFYDRGATVDEQVNPLDGNLFFLKGQRWRYMRQKLSPIFTSGKLRWMYQEMEKCGDNFLNCFARHNGKEIDLKNDLQGLTTDVIGSTAFGLDIDSMENPNSEFRVMGMKVFVFESYLDGLRFAGRMFFPEILQRFKIKTFSRELDVFFTSMITQSFDSRIKTGLIRKDIVQLLLELKQKGSVSLDAKETEDFVEKQDNQEVAVKIELTDELLAAQSFVFFVAGFETTASTMYFALYLLSKHPEYQAKAREEIQAVKAKFGGKIEFDCLKELEYLEKCILETLRLYAPVPFLMRECTKNYTFPTGAQVEKGTFVLIPIHSIHHDSDYFPDPESFKPERFNQPPKPGTFLPFGDGPRVCIGKRFALTEIKMALASILDRYSIEKSDKTIEPIVFKADAPVTTPKHGLYIKVKKL